MTNRDLNLSQLRDYAGTYPSKKALVNELSEYFPEHDLNYGLQYVQLINRNGVASNWYNSELSRLIQVTFITNPDKTCTILPYYVTR